MDGLNVFKRSLLNTKTLIFEKKYLLSMTIAVTVKVHDGVVLAADSATTLFSERGVSNVYNNANKVFNLYKTLPIGAISYGLGGIGNASMSTLMKDLRRKITGLDSKNSDWKLNSEDYKMCDVAELVKQFFYDDLYAKYFKDAKIKPVLGFIIAGYSSNEDLAEEYRIEIIEGVCRGPELIRNKEEAGIAWGGEQEAIHRLVCGFGMNLPQALKEMGIKDNDIGPAIDFIKGRLGAPLVPSAMPIQDAIDLAEYLVNTTIMFSRFTPGAPTVGGPIEIATITKHEDFKWVQRKHYWDEQFNPREFHNVKVRK
jgi:hypothetical protein